MEKRKVIFGLILVGIGFILLARSLDLIDFSFGEFRRYIWPTILIGIGLWMVLRKRGPAINVQYFSSSSGKSQTWSSQSQTGSAKPATPGLDPSQAIPPNFVHAEPRQDDMAKGTRLGESPSSTSEGRVKYGKFLGDLFIECDGIDLRNVEVSGGVGDVEIRLRGGKLSPGLNRMVVSSMVGDVRITIPRTIAWYAQGSNFVGDIEIGENRTSGFGNQIEGQSADYASAQSKVYIAINSFVGDVRVHSV
jgi:lia operon protein LiaF